eukprot:432643-Pyramimonas_sp.AAC.1
MGSLVVQKNLGITDGKQFDMAYVTLMGKWRTRLSLTIHCEVANCIIVGARNARGGERLVYSRRGSSGRQETFNMLDRVEILDRCVLKRIRFLYGDVKEHALTLCSVYCILFAHPGGRPAEPGSVRCLALSVGEHRRARQERPHSASQVHFREPLACSLVHF